MGKAFGKVSKCGTYMCVVGRQCRVLLLCAVCWAESRASTEPDTSGSQAVLKAACLYSTQSSQCWHDHCSFQIFTKYSWQAWLCVAQTATITSYVMTVHQHHHHMGTLWNVQARLWPHTAFFLVLACDWSMLHGSSSFAWLYTNCQLSCPEECTTSNGSVSNSSIVKPLKPIKV